MNMDDVRDRMRRAMEDRVAAAVVGQYLVMHLATLERLRKHITEAGATTTCGPAPYMAGMPVVTNAMAPEFETEWRFPEDRFVEYEESDRDWCKYFGFGGYHETNRPAVFQVTPPKSWADGGWS